MLINKNWTFYKKGEEDKKIVVDVPYDAMLREERSIESLGGDKVGFFLGGDYIYEKDLDLKKEDLDGRVIYLRFEGVYHDPVIYINGKEAYKRNYGYTDFIFDATRFLIIGTNHIKVEATNSDQPNSRWYSGAGIYRSVHMYNYPSTHILPRSLRILTLDYTTGKVKVSAKISASTTTELKVLDKEEKEVYRASIESDAPVFEFEIPDVHLWNQDTPYLYTFVLSIEGQEERKRSGVRQLELNTEKGFLINGVRAILNGCCIHSDNGMLGAESYPDVERRKIKIMKEAGYTAIRSAHNPIVESFLDAADEEGFLVMDEYVDCWYFHKTEYDYALHCQDNYQDDLAQMVEKDYNHPSVVLYSTGNEVGETAFPKGIAFTKDLTECLHKLDDSRPVTCGINVFFNGIAHTPFAVYSDTNAEKDLEKKKKENEKREKEEKSGTAKKKKVSGSSDIFNTIANFFGQNFMKTGAKIHLVDVNTRDAFANMDVAGYNYGIKRYKKDLKKYPNRFILGSETFCNDAGYFYDLYQKNPRVIGDFVWSGMDYLGEAGFNSWANGLDHDFTNDPSGWLTDGGGRININGEWLSEMDYTRICFRLDTIAIGVVSPHDKEGFMHGAAWKFSRALRSYDFQGHEGKDIDIEVYTWAKYAELYQNGKLLKKYTNKKEKNNFVVKAKYVPGELKAIAYDEKHNKIGEATLCSHGDEVILGAFPEQKTYHVGEMAFVHIRFCDENGNVKPLENQQVEITSVEGGTLIRFGTAARWNKVGYLTNKDKTYYGRCMAIVQADKPGTITLKAKAEDGKEASCSIEIVE